MSCQNLPFWCHTRWPVQCGRCHSCRWCLGRWRACSCQRRQLEEQLCRDGETEERVVIWFWKPHMGSAFWLVQPFLRMGCWRSKSKSSKHREENIGGRGDDWGETVESSYRPKPCTWHKSKGEGEIEMERKNAKMLKALI